MGSTQRWVRGSRHRHDGEAPVVGIVLPTRNDRSRTLECLESVYELDYPSALLAVIDNGSIDMTAATIRSRFPEVQLIQNKRNLGSARARNQGIRWSFAQGADYVLVLDRDKLPDTNLLTRLVDAAEIYPDAGIFGPKIRRNDDDGTLWFTAYRFDGEPDIVDPHRRGPLVRSSCPAEVDYVSSSAMLISRQLFETIGGFCERYFDCYEDLDYCVRARQHGFAVMYIPHATLTHRAGEAEERAELRGRYLRQLRGRLIFDQRNHHGFSLIGRSLATALRIAWTTLTRGAFLTKSQKPTASRGAARPTRHSHARHIRT